jgi:outer membrane protein, heavy metal efflux system
MPGLPTPAPMMPPAVNVAGLGGQSISLQLALYGALTSNPDLVALRQGNPIAPSAEAVEVARRFPTTLNPTVWIDYRPITLIPPNTFGSTSPGGGGGTSNHGGFYHYGQNYILVSIRQPVELGHQTTHRYHIAKAAYEQQQWNVIQMELTTLVQTYRFFQTAAYRREKYRLAQQLADFNDRLAASLQRQLETGQGQVTAADAALARVESRGSRQAVKAARQDYLTALADLRNQIGIPESAGAVEPLGEFTLPGYIPPVDEQAMVETALANRPDIRAAQAQIAGTHAAVNLAKGDRIPTPVIGPQYGMDEAGVQYVGLILVSSLPIWNSGKPLVAQREAEHQRAAVAAAQAQQRAVSQVRAAVARWNGATDLVNDSAGLSEELAKEVAGLERLFELRQTDLMRLMQARQRLIQLDNSRLDAVWAATQAQADLLLALGTPSLIHGMLNQAEQAAGAPAAPNGAPAPTMPSPSPSASTSPAASAPARPAAALAAPSLNPTAPVRR